MRTFSHGRYGLGAKLIVGRGSGSVVIYKKDDVSSLCLDLWVGDILQRQQQVAEGSHFPTRYVTLVPLCSGVAAATRLVYMAMKPL